MSTRQSRKRFRERLRQWRRKRSFTQEELAKRAAVPKISVSHFETGHRFPNAESLRRLADALGVSADYLLGRVKNPVGKDIVASDPEVVVLLRRFQTMSQQARDQVKQLFQIVDATDRKRRLLAAAVNCTLSADENCTLGGPRRGPWSGLG